MPLSNTHILIKIYSNPKTTKHYSSFNFCKFSFRNALDDLIDRIKFIGTFVNDNQTYKKLIIFQLCDSH